MNRSSRLLLAAALLALPRALPAQEQGFVTDLAQLLALEDRREYDGGALRRAAQHPDALVRAHAATTVGRIGDPAGAPILLQLLTDPDSGVQTEAAFAIGLLRDGAAVPEMVRRLESFPAATTSETDIEIVTALAKIGSGPAAQALAGLLGRHPPTGAQEDLATAQALLEAWRLGALAPGDRLVAYVRDGQGLWRRNAVFSAARLRLPAAAAALVDATTDADPLTRQWAARALTAELADSARIPRSVFVGRLRQLVADSDAQVRTNAVRAIGTFRDSTLVSLVAARLVDHDQNVIVQAVGAVGVLGGSRAVALLADRFAQPGTFAVRRALLQALAAAAPARALATGLPWKTDGDWRMRGAYAEMLGIAATPEARAELATLSDDADGRVVAGALSALRQVAPAGDTALRRLAVARLEHADPVVRSSAIDILGREQDPALLPAFVAAYRRAARDELNDARLSAVDAVGRIAAVSPAARQRAEREFLAAVGRSDDYLVRRAVAERFGEEVHERLWGPVLPIETGRGAQDYQRLVRQYVVPTPGTAAPRATIETERGTIVVELFGAEAPLTVDNFLRLIDRRYFDGGRWHRVVPNFVIQDGDPRGDGNGGPGTMIRDELNRHRYDRGTLGMALSGPDTGGSQFFLTHSPQPHLAGRYTVFGRLASGPLVLDLIVQGDRIRRITR